MTTKIIELTVLRETLSIEEGFKNLEITVSIVLGNVEYWYKASPEDMTIVGMVSGSELRAKETPEQIRAMVMSCD